MLIRYRRGFSLVEALVEITILVLVATSVYQSFTNVFKATAAAQNKVTAAALGDEQIEIIRNLPYSDVGVVSGVPSGKIPHVQTLVRDGASFTVTTTIRNIDDPFDGTIGGTPKDLSPADYKLVEVEVACAACRNFTPFDFNTTVAPRALENSSTNGALFVKVFDANGQPVADANVHIENNQKNPPIIIDDTTNSTGILQVVDTPPGASAYEITVSKTGYSTEKTYPSGAVGNPNPSHPHATVAVQQLTQTSFAIDKISQFQVASVGETCSTTPSVAFSLAGTKLIGTNPNVLKYPSVNFTTTGSGQKTISNLEWDTYNFTLTDNTKDLVGTIPSFPLNLSPNTAQDMKLIVAPKNPSSLLVAVKDGATGLPLSDATVELVKGTYDNSLITGHGFLNQTDWSGGAGQDLFYDATRYADSDGQIDTGSPIGELRLTKIFSQYNSNGVLTSSTFDTGSASNFHQLTWQPADQPPETGANPVRFQIATNQSATSSWDFFGPDGTVNTFYTLANTNISASHNGDRYLRYRVFLQTASSTFTPNIGSIAFTFTSDCVPPGQVLFSGLSNGTYTLTVSKTGYQPTTVPAAVSSNWQEQDVVLSP